MHVFLTGPKRVGKSTLLNAILAAYPGKAGGFRTVRTKSFLHERYSVHLLPALGGEPEGGNLLFVCGSSDGAVLERFNRLGCEALRDSADSQLLVMDELGPHEAGAAAFQAAVWQAVEGPIPILGVLQEADSEFLNKIARHPNTFLLRVTESSREALALRIPEFLQILR